MKKTMNRVERGKSTPSTVLQLDKRNKWATSETHKTELKKGHQKHSKFSRKQNRCQSTHEVNSNCSIDKCTPIPITQTSNNIKQMEDTISTVANLNKKVI